MPLLHVQNVFDAFDPSGGGVVGRLKRKCLKRQDRGAALAGEGDFAAVQEGCAGDYFAYLSRLTGVRPVPCRFPVDADPAVPLDSRAVIGGLRRSRSWRTIVDSAPELRPYLRSASLLKAAREAGLRVGERQWTTVVGARVPEAMNDKAVLYRECEELGVPVPRFTVATRATLAEEVAGMGVDAYVRATHGAGALANVTVRRAGARWDLPEMRAEGLTWERLREVLGEYAAGTHVDEFVVAELLDVESSPASLFYLAEDGVSLCAHTMQVLDERRGFTGFTYPLDAEAPARRRAEMEREGLRLMEPWRRRGYRGYANVDWLLARDGRLLVAERNARETSAVAPLAVMRRMLGLPPCHPVLPGDLAVSTRDELPLARPASFPEVLSALERVGVTWTEDRAFGIVVTMPPSPAAGSDTVGVTALAPDPAHAEELIGTAAAALASPAPALSP